MAKDPSRELGRLLQRPLDQPPSGLLAWEIEQLDDPGEYALRLRTSLLSALTIASRGDFDAEEIESGSLPDWFVAVTEGRLDVDAIPSACRLGQERYYQTRDENRWTVQEWLFCLDPDLRHWEWWDLTSRQGRVILWMDSKGEPIFACEELVWAVFAAGANSMANLGVLQAEEWARQTSLGV